MLKAGATLALPAGASQFTCSGRFSVADTSAVLDVSSLFANGEPAGNEVTILTAGGVGSIPTIRGAADGWTPVKTGTSLKLVKNANEAMEWTGEIDISVRPFTMTEDAVEEFVAACAPV